MNHKMTIQFLLIVLCTAVLAATASATAIRYATSYTTSAATYGGYNNADRTWDDDPSSKGHYYYSGAGIFYDPIGQGNTEQFTVTHEGTFDMTQADLQSFSVTYGYTAKGAGGNVSPTYSGWVNNAQINVYAYDYAQSQFVKLDTIGEEAHPNYGDPVVSFYGTAGPITATLSLTPQQQTDFVQSGQALLRLDISAFRWSNYHWRTYDLYDAHANVHVDEQPEVPEPATMLAGLAGLAGVGRYLRRRK